MARLRRERLMLFIPGEMAASDPLWTKIIFATISLVLLLIAMRQWWKNRR